LIQRQENARANHRKSKANRRDAHKFGERLRVFGLDVLVHGRGFHSLLFDDSEAENDDDNPNENNWYAYDELDVGKHSIYSPLCLFSKVIRLMMIPSGYHAIPMHHFFFVGQHITSPR